MCRVSTPQWPSTYLTFFWRRFLWVSYYFLRSGVRVQIRCLSPIFTFFEVGRAHPSVAAFGQIGHQTSKLYNGDWTWGIQISSRKKDVLGGPKDVVLEISAIRSKALRHRAPIWSLRSVSRVARCLSVDAAQHRSSPCASPSFITQYQTSNQKLVNQQTLTLFSIFVV